MEEKAGREKEVWRKYIVIGNKINVTWIFIYGSGAGTTQNPCHFNFLVFHNGKIRVRGDS